MTRPVVAADLVDVLAAALEQASPEQRARLRAALELDEGRGAGHAPERAAYTPATLAAELGRSPRAIRGAIARGELDAVKRGRGWVIGADAVERWAAASRGAARGRTSPRPERRAGADGTGAQRGSDRAPMHVGSTRTRRPGGARTPPARPEPNRRFR